MREPTRQQCTASFAQSKVQFCHCLVGVTCGSCVSRAWSRGASACAGTLRSPVGVIRRHEKMSETSAVYKSEKESKRYTFCCSLYLAASVASTCALCSLSSWNLVTNGMGDVVVSSRVYEVTKYFVFGATTTAVLSVVEPSSLPTVLNDAVVVLWLPLRGLVVSEAVACPRLSFSASVCKW